tara:strand:+ start:181 stop:882 length:702 start_codon:yes stop_codon:yes gene_type:complete
MKLLQFEYNNDLTFDLHIESNREKELYFSDGNMIEFPDFKSAKDYFKNQIEYAFLNYKPRYTSIQSFIGDTSVESGEEIEEKMYESLKKEILNFVDLVKCTDIKLVYDILLKKVFPKHSDQFPNLYNYYFAEHFFDKEKILAEMFDNYKSNILDWELLSTDRMSNKEKTVCLDGFMDMYASHRRRLIGHHESLTDNLPMWLEDYIGEKKLQEIKSIIDSKHTEEKAILHNWGY